jgi:hypothetical protein
MFVNTAKKYSPKALSDFIFPTADAKDIVELYVYGGEERPLVLHGSNGTGKSLLQRLIPDAIEGFAAQIHVVKCNDLKSASAIHDLYGRNKMFQKIFKINNQKFNHITIEEFLITDKKMSNAFKVELDDTLGTDLTILSTNDIEKVDRGILSRSNVLELRPCEPHIFFPHAKNMFLSEGVCCDDEILFKCLESSYNSSPDNRKYYQAIDSLFRSF